MATNDFIGFASSGNANVMSQADYAAAHEQLVGVQPGMASSAMANKVWRQGANMAAALGYLMYTHGYDALDDGDILKLAKNLLMALAVAVEYNITYDFKSGSVCRYNGDLYIALVDNGPSTSVKNPTDATAWRAYLPSTGGTMTGSLKAKMTGVRGTPPSSRIEQYFPDYIDANNSRYGLLQVLYNTDMSSEIAMLVYDTTQATGTNIGRLGIGCDPNGTVYTEAPTPATNDKSQKIATTEYVQNNIGVVTNGSGAKTSAVSNDSYFNWWRRNNIVITQFMLKLNTTLPIFSYVVCATGLPRPMSQIGDASWGFLVTDMSSTTDSYAVVNSTGEIQIGARGSNLPADTSIYGAFLYLAEA
jgi:hypothetical protein